MSFGVCVCVCWWKNTEEISEMFCFSGFFSLVGWRFAISFNPLDMTSLFIYIILYPIFISYFLTVKLHCFNTKPVFIDPMDWARWTVTRCDNVPFSQIVKRLAIRCDCRTHTYTGHQYQCRRTFFVLYYWLLQIKKCV